MVNDTCSPGTEAVTGFLEGGAQHGKGGGGTARERERVLTW